MTRQDDTDRPGASPGDLLREILAGISRLVQGEIALVRAEARQRTGAVQKGLLLGVGAALLAITALNILAGAAVMVVAQMSLSPVWAAVVVALAIGGAAYVCVYQATAAFRRAITGQSNVGTNIARDLQTLKMTVKRDATA